jgi:acyl-CoA thioesterase FadM
MPFIETYRRTVTPLDCDVFGHMNIAYYPDRFAAAALTLLERLAPAARWRTLGIDTRYLAELRAGAGVILRSAVLGVEGDIVRVAHEAVSPAGERTTLAEHRLACAGPRVSLAPSPDLAWESFLPLDLPAGAGPIPSGRDRWRGADDSPGLHVQCFSDACLFVMEAIGMTESYRRQANRGFATFETRLALEHPGPEPGDGFVITSGILSIGGSSLRLAHRMCAAGDGRTLARFYQAGVHFDLAARRGTAWPPEIRAQAERLGFTPA